MTVRERDALHVGGESHVSVGKGRDINLQCKAQEGTEPVTETGGRKGKRPVERGESPESPVLAWAVWLRAVDWDVMMKSGRRNEVQKKKKKKKLLSSLVLWWERK